MKKKPDFTVAALSESILKGNRYQTLKGVTSSSITHTMTRLLG